LLLTFFYRQMPDIIQRGHVFIAQPPLYRVKRGKQVQYLKDDRALEQYLLQIGLEDARLFVNPHAPAIQGQGLEQLTKDHQSMMELVNRLSRRHQLPKFFLEAMAHLNSFSDHLQDQTKAEAWLGEYRGVVAKLLPLERNPIKVDLKLIERDGYFLPQLNILSHGMTNQHDLGVEFWRGHDYHRLLQLGTPFKDLLEPGAYLQKGDKKLTLVSFGQALRSLLEDAKKGQQIQRYKGLGEMNPEQLWETTMDPAVRRMIEVKIEDAVAADAMFTTLMGDNVESRREFIEQNALLVENLDV